MTALENLPDYINKVLKTRQILYYLYDKYDSSIGSLLTISGKSIKIIPFSGNSQSVK